MMASKISNIPVKTSVERKKHSYRFTIDVATLNAWQFDLSESEFHELYKQMTQAQTNAPQPDLASASMIKSYYDHPTVPGLQAIDIVQAFSYNVGTAMTYLWRWGRKPNADPMEDGRKAIQHIRFEIKRLQGCD